MRVLYVEDDSAHVELARRTLESGQFDCTLDSVETIQGALSRLEADPQYDVVLTDLLLPDGNGLDLIRLIRGRKSPPAVVLVTGQGNQDSAVAALKAGAADYIVKQSDYLHRLPVAVHNAFAQNILAREHAALDEAQARYRALFEQSHDAVFILDLQGKYIDVNRRATDMLGYAKEEIQRLSLADLSVEPEENQQIVTRLLRGKSFPPFEGKVRRKNGEIITTEITLELVRDGSGQPLHIQSVVRDITQRKKTEEALRASEERYRLIFEDNPLPMWVCDLETLNFLAVNDAATVHYGYNREEFLQMTIKDIRPSEDIPVLPENILHVTSDLDEAGIWRHIKKDGTIILVEITSYAMSFDGRRAELVLANDVTVRKQAEEALARRINELTVLHASALAISTATNSDKLIEQVTNVISDILYQDNCGVLLLNKEGNALKHHSSYRGVTENDLATTIPLNRGITGRAATSQKNIRIGDVTKEPDYLPFSPNIHSELCVPIKAGERVIGVINTESTLQNAYTEQDERLLTTIANALATGIEKLHLFEETQRRSRELDVLYQASKVMTESFQPEAIAQDLIETMEKLIGYEYGAVLLLNESTQELVPLALSHKGHDDISHIHDLERIRNLKIKPGEGVVGWVVQHGKPARIGKTPEDPRYLSVRETIQSELCVPLLVRDKVIGVLNIETAKPNTYDERDENLLIALASSAAIALENAKLYEAERIRREEAESLRLATATLGAMLELQPLLGAILDSLKRIIPYDSASIFLEHSQDEMEVAACRGFPEPAKIMGRRVLWTTRRRQLALSGKVVIIPDTQADPGFEKWEGAEHVRSWMGVPMIVQDKVIGIINLDNRTVNAFTERDVTIAQTFANSAAVAIQNAYLFQSELRRRKEAEILREATLALTYSIEPEKVYEVVLEALEKLIPYDSASIELVDQKDVEIVAGRKFPNPDRIIGMRYQASVDKWEDLSRIRNPIIIPDVQKDDRFEKFEETGYIRGWLGIPLFAHDKLRGFVNLDSRTENFFTPEHAKLAQTFCNQAAAAIENAHLFQEEIRRTKIIETLADVANEIATTRDIIPILDKIAQRALDLLQANDVAIYLIHDDNDTIKTISARGANREELLLHSLKIGEGTTGNVVATGIPDIVDDVVGDPRRILASGTSENEVQHETMMSAPLILRGKPIGAINAWRLRSNGFFNQTELSFLISIAHQISVAIESARLFQETMRRAQEAAAIAEVSRGISATLQLDIVLNRIASYAKELLNAESSAVYLADPTQPTLKAVTALGLDVEQIQNDPIEMGKGILGNIALSKTGEIVNDTINDLRTIIIKGTDATPYEHIMGVPVLAKDQLTGLVVVWRNGIDAGFTSKDLDFLINLAQQAAVAIENARLFEAEQRRRQEAETLRQAATAISSTLELNHVLEEIMTALKKVVPYHSVSVFFQEGEQLRIAISQGFREPEKLIGLAFPADDALFQQIKQTGRPIILNDAQTEPLFHKWGDTNNIHGWMAIPLITRGMVIGYITLDSQEIGTYDESISNTALAFAHQAAVAIENARLYDETQHRLKELEAINHVSTKLRSAQTVEEMLPVLLDETLSLLKTDHGSVWLYDPLIDRLVQRAARGYTTKLKYTSLKPNEGIIGRTFSSGSMHLSTEIVSDPLLFKGNLESIPPGLGGACIPIQSTAGAVGALIIGIEKERRISDEINRLTTLCEIAGNAIHRAELYEHSQEQVRRLTTLRDIDAAIASSFDLRVTLSILAEHALKHLNVDAIDILLFHPELQSFTYMVGMGFQAAAPSRPLRNIGDGLAGQVVLRQKIYHITDLQRAPEIQQESSLIREGFVTYIGVPLLVKGQIKGVLEILHRTQLSPSADWMQFLQTLSGQAAIAIDNAQLFLNLQRSNQELTQAYDTTLAGWGSALELRDKETQGHTNRVVKLTLELAELMGVSEAERVHLRRGVLLHDIGKMGVPDQILKKTGPLTEAEWREMRQHPQYAYDLLSPISYLRLALDIPYCHHEHWDGSGYPRRLKGEQIPLAARIFSVIDVWDALLHDRPYRKAWPVKKVIKYLQEQSGKILDPRVVETFLKMVSEESDAV